MKGRNRMSLEIEGIEMVEEMSQPSSRSELISRYSSSSSWPTTMRAYQESYATGLLDFESPPPIPTSEGSNTFWTQTGQMLAPTSTKEPARQRAVNSVMNNPAHFKLEALRNLDAIVSESNKKELQSIVTEGRKQFSSSIVNVSIMDKDSQIFLVQDGADWENLVREETACSHAILKATATNDDTPFVCLDLQNDFRFAKNNYNSLRFYAAAPIYGEAFGDTKQPIGLVCVIDFQARAEFSSNDRKALQQLAQRATDSISQRTKKRSKILGIELSGRRNLFLDNPLVSEFRAPLAVEPSKKFITTQISPTYLQPELERYQDAVYAGIYTNISPSTTSLLSLSLQLLTETLDLTTSYVVSVAARGSKSWSWPEKPILLISSFNLPRPPPLFDYSMHHSLDALPLVYTQKQADLESDEFKLGIIVKLYAMNDVSFILGAFSDEKKSFSSEDLFFIAKFAEDMRRVIQSIR